jgi:transcriptional regulator with GAF, ATPase, and Fis domain
VDERIAAEKRIRLLLDEAEYLRESAGIGEMLGQSAAMKELFTSLKRVAATDATVLVLGETGTGKELIARSIILSPGSRLELHRAMPAASVATPPPAAEGDSTRILTAAEMEALERANIQRALDACGGKISGEGGAAALLGMNPSTLRSRLQAPGLKAPAG